jgi:hypothetical protein
LVARHAIDEQSAYEMLRKHARFTGRKLLDLWRGRRRPPAASEATAGAFVALTGFAARDGRRDPRSRRSQDRAYAGSV